MDQQKFPKRGKIGIDYWGPTKTMDRSTATTLMGDDSYRGANLGGAENRTESK
jgi:hypothetical protein